MNQSTRETLKIIGIATVACIIVAGIAYAIIKITVAVTVPLVWTVGTTGVIMVVLIVSVIVIGAGIAIVAAVTFAGLVVTSAIVSPDEEET
jgi:hypothetical protein